MLSEFLISTRIVNFKFRLSSPENLYWKISSLFDKMKIMLAKM